MGTYEFTLKFTVECEGREAAGLRDGLDGMDAGELLRMLGSGLPGTGSVSVTAGLARGVEVTCYGQTTRWSSREAAILHYREACAGCDPASSECSRYSRVLAGLLSGAFRVDDG